jgi:hypothetical protein
MREQCVGQRATMLALSVLALTVIGLGLDAVAANEIEYTRAAQELFNGLVNSGRSRIEFAKSIFSYCTQTSNHLPRNTQKEDAQLAAELASNDIDRITRASATIQSSRSQLQKALNDCAQTSKSILEQTNSPTEEATLWVRLEGTLDLDVGLFGADIGVFRKDEKNRPLSDLHGLGLWPMVRAVIRKTVILPLLGSR